jgi:hypothetical protein
MYIEASAPQMPGQMARLWTPVTTPSAGSCLTFWYNMNGRSMGTLNIYAVATSGGNISLGNPIWRKSGNQGTIWFQEYVLLPNIAQYKVRIDLEY